MKTYENAKAAHEANNEVMLAARRMAEERGLLMAVVVASDVDGRAHQTIGVEYTRVENGEHVTMIAAAMLGVLDKKHSAPASQLAALIRLGGAKSAEALDRDRVGDETEEERKPSVSPTAAFVDSEHRDNPLCPHCGDEADGEELFEDEEGDLLDGDEKTVGCAACGQTFVTTCHITVTYSTRKP